jgi:hypothetical protein
MSAGLSLIPAFVLAGLVPAIQFRDEQPLG